MDSDAWVDCPRCGWLHRDVCRYCKGKGEVPRSDGFDEYERTTAEERFRDREAERDAERRKE